MLYRACGRPECNFVVQCFFFVILLDFLVGKSRSKYSALNYDLSLHVPLYYRVNPNILSPVGDAVPGYGCRSPNHTCI